jgi:hypothetical protein
VATQRIFLDAAQLRRLYNVKHLGIDDIAAKLGSSHGTVWRAMESFGIERRKLSEAVRKHQRKDFSENKSEKAYLIGLRLGDLWVKKNKPGLGSKTVVVSCHSSRQEQVELVKSLFSEYGHVRTTYSSKGTIRVMCYMNTSFDFLLPKKDQIPFWIMRQSGWFLSFLAGYVDAEGSFCVDRHERPSFQLKSYDINILKGISRFLPRLGVECNGPRLAQSRGSPTGKGYALNKDAWVFSIAQKKMLRRFCRLIIPHLKHSKRKNDAAKVLGHLQNVDL